MSFNAGQIVPFAYDAGFRGSDLVTSVAVALAESRGQPGINNAGMNADGSVDYGLWQINSVHGPDLDEIYDPQANANWAYKIWSDAGGWSPWVAHDNGSYRRFLDQARNAVEGFRPEEASASNAPTRTLEQTQAPRSGRLRAESMLASVARAAQKRAVSAHEQARSTTNVTAEEYDRRAQLPVGEIDPLVPRQVDPTARINAALQRFVVEPAQDVADVADGGQEPSGIWEGIPDVDVEKWLSKGLKENAARGAAIARAFGFAGTIHGVGSRPPSSKSDHPHGNAIDLMTFDNKVLGQQIAEYFLDNREGLRVKYIIFDNTIWSASRGWEPREYRHPSGRSNSTLNHEDHPHISFY